MFKKLTTTLVAFFFLMNQMPALALLEAGDDIEMNLLTHQPPKGLGSEFDEETSYFDQPGNSSLIAHLEEQLSHLSKYRKALISTDRIMDGCDICLQFSALAVITPLICILCSLVVWGTFFAPCALINPNTDDC